MVSFTLKVKFAVTFIFCFVGSPAASVSLTPGHATHRSEFLGASTVEHTAAESLLARHFEQPGKEAKERNPWKLNCKQACIGLLAALCMLLLSFLATPSFGERVRRNLSEHLLAEHQGCLTRCWWCCNDCECCRQCGAFLCGVCLIAGAVAAWRQFLDGRAMNGWCIGIFIITTCVGSALLGLFCMCCWNLLGIFFRHEAAETDITPTEAETEEHKVAFSRMDKEGKGYISFSDANNFLHSQEPKYWKASVELHVALRSQGRNPSEACKLCLAINTSSTVVVRADIVGSGTFNFQEFQSLMMRKIKDTDTEEWLIKAFSVFNRTGDGLISRPELKHVMNNNLGAKLTDEEIDEMIREADLDGDGQINYAEFVQMMFEDRKKVCRALRSESARYCYAEFKAGFDRALEETEPTIDKITEVYFAFVEERNELSANKGGETSELFHTKDLRIAVQALGKNLTKAEIQKIIVEVNSENEAELKETMELVVFVKVVGRKVMGIDTTPWETRETFHAFDLDEDGVIATSELKQGMADIYGQTMSDTEIAEIMRESDLNKDGVIDLYEFAHMLLQS